MLPNPLLPPVARAPSQTCVCYSQGCGSSKIFLLPFPALYKVSRFRVCFRFQLFSSKCFRFQLPQKFNRFHIRAPCFMKNTSISGSSKSQMLPSSLPLPASFFKVLLLPLPQKFNRFQHRFNFQLPLPHPWYSSILLQFFLY